MICWKQLLQLSLALTTLCGRGATQIQGNCPAISNSNDYKIIVDAINLVGAKTPDGTIVLTRLRQKVQFAVTAVQVELETNPEVIVIPCPDRAPQDPSEFNPIIVDALNGHRVLIELWGRIEALSGLNLQRAVLNYTVVPVSQYDRSFIPQGGFATKYQRRLRETPDDLAKIFGEFSDLKTYMSIAAGVKSLKEHSYDQAYKSLCQADSLLAVTPASIEPALRATLRTYVARKLGDTIAGARADKSAKTALALDGVLPTCPSSLP